MTDRQTKLRASKPAAQAAKDAFASRYIAGHNDLAVGLGLTSDGADWAMLVYARTPAAARALPDHYGDFAVRVEVTGRARAY